MSLSSIAAVRHVPHEIIGVPCTCAECVSLIQSSRGVHGLVKMAMCRPGNRPRMLMCYLCGREYGSRSLNIHISQCQRKWLLEEERKPRNERRPLPPQPNADRPTRNGGAQAFDNFNAEAFAASEQSLEQCPHCRRRFEEKAYLRHQKGCTAARPAKPAGTGLIRFSLTNRLVPGAVAGSMHGKAKAQPLPLRFCRPPPVKSKPKLKSTARPAWTSGDGPSFDEKLVPMVRPKPSVQEWCLQSETCFSTLPPSNRKTKVPNSRTASFDGNPCRHHGGGDNSHLVSSFGNLWQTHKDSYNLPSKMSVRARELCSQEDLMPLRRIAINPQMAKSQCFSSTSQVVNRQPPIRQPPISASMQSSKVGHRKFVF